MAKINADEYFLCVGYVNYAYWQGFRGVAIYYSNMSKAHPQTSAAKLLL